MKTILIIYPHWHPANLAGVQRPRLIGNYLTQYGWKPRVITVESHYFEETPDLDFEKTFSPDFEVTRVKAFNVTHPRIIGDIGLRAFYQLYKGALQIIKNENIDFIWLPIPSFYNALLGRLIYDKTKVPYGIDYIDPWVRDLTNQKNIRARVSQFFARLLEPIAVKKASLISGVSYPYYEPVIKRNFPSIYAQLTANNPDLSSNNKINNTCSTSLPLITHHSQPITNPHTHLPFAHVAMPYGFDPHDHQIKIENLQYPWKTTPNKPLPNHHLKIWIYAGAFLPNSHVLLNAFFQAMGELRKKNQFDNSIRLWFLGTGLYPAKRITAYAEDHGLSDIVFENRDRFPFLHVLNFLAEANTIMIIGSTEKHYTASKTYQSLLTEKPVLCVFHHESSAVKVMETCKADQFTVRYNPKMNQNELIETFKSILTKRIHTDRWEPDLAALDHYSAKESAKKLVEGIEKVL